MRSTDLPTKPCESGVFETNAPKTSNVKDFQNMYQIKPKKQIIFVMIFFTSIGQ